MIITIAPSKPAALEDADNFRAFKVVCTSPRADCEAGLAEIGRLDGDHVWVDPTWIRRNGRPAEEWTTGFDKMVAFAASSGWVDDAGAIRAHIEER